MGKFLALIMAAAAALFIAAPAMAQVDVTKSVDNSNTASTNFTTDVNVNKDVDITVSGDLDATGGVNVSGDSIFKELDVNVQDQENVVKFFELDDSATSKWTISGAGVMNAAEQLQNGEGNQATIRQNPLGLAINEMNVGLQYQVGAVNGALIVQGFIPNGGGTIPPPGTNNFAKQIQIGGLNGAEISQH